MKEIIEFDIDIEESDKIQDSHGLWPEKYRPRKMEEFIGSDFVKDAAKLAVERGQIPHMILKGPHGVGKTSLAKLLIRLIPCDYLYINASNENSVDTVREKIMDFVMSMSFKPVKIILLDEADRLTSEAQSTLKNIMEEYSSNNRFIMTTNYAEKLEGPIVSRCQVFEIKALAKGELALKLSDILKAEGIKYDPKDIVFIVNTYYPDFRKMLVFSQQCSIKGTLVLPAEASDTTDMKEKLVALLKEAKSVAAFKDIRQMVADANFSSYDEVYKYLYEHVSDFSKGKDVDIILEIAESMYQSALVFEKEITFVAAMLRILRILCK